MFSILNPFFDYEKLKYVNNNKKQILLLQIFISLYKKLYEIDMLKNI